MLVVSNTSPVTNLAAVGRLDILQHLYGQITVPEEVRDELVFGGSGNNPGASEVRAGEWFTILPADNLQRDQLLRQFRAVHRGEAAALALAKQHRADLVLLDDRAAREAARSLQLAYTGIVGVLLAAKHAEFIPWVKPVLDDLRTIARFHLAERVYQAAIQAAGE